MALIRDVRYTEGALSTLITDGNYAQYVCGARAIA